MSGTGQRGHETGPKCGHHARAATPETSLSLSVWAVRFLSLSLAFAVMVKLETGISGEPCRRPGEERSVKVAGHGRDHVHHFPGGSP